MSVQVKVLNKERRPHFSHIWFIITQNKLLAGLKIQKHFWPDSSCSPIWQLFVINCGLQEVGSWRRRRCDFLPEEKQIYLVLTYFFSRKLFEARWEERYCFLVFTMSKIWWNMMKTNSKTHPVKGLNVSELWPTFQF